MLYEQWLEIAAAFPDRIGLRDLAVRNKWTFGEIAALIQQITPSKEKILFPQGGSAEFIFTVLRAWRDQQVICPLEEGQSAQLVDSVPPGIVHLKTTSATTGASRLVAFRPEQLRADADNIVQTMGLSVESPNLGVISLAHSYGFSNLVLPLLLHGIPLILVGSALPEAVRRAAALEHAVTLAAVPALWSRWHEVDSIPANVTLAISAGAPLSSKLERSVYEQRGLKIHNFYGSTECGGIAYDASAEPRAEGSCTGVPMKNVEISVNGSGCLEVRSGAVGQTYWPEPAENLRDGVFRTSDLAQIRGREVHLLGRAGDQINVAGRKVSPETIERALASHPLVRECVAFGVTNPNAERGDTIVACLAVSGQVNSETLKQFLMTRLPAWQVPREWKFIDALGANHRGKLSRAEWKRHYLEESKRKQR